MLRNSFFPLQFFISRQKFTAICFYLYHDILLAFSLPFLSQQCFLCLDIILALLQELLRQCHDIKLLCQDIVLSSDFHYAATFISLLQHFSFNPSHIMSRQSCEISRQSFASKFSSALSLLRHITACCDTALLVALNFYCNIMRLCRDILGLCRDIMILCCDISALPNFFAAFLVGFVSFTFKTCKT